VERVVQLKLGQMPERCSLERRRVPLLGVASARARREFDRLDEIYDLGRHSFAFSDCTDARPHRFPDIQDRTMISAKRGDPMSAFGGKADNRQLIRHGTSFGEKVQQ
jgi:hypothetical protein